MKKRNLFLISLFACLAAAIFFRMALLTVAIEWSLKRYCHTSLKNALHYDRLTWDGTSLIIDHPILTRLNGKTSFRARQIALSCSPEWLCFDFNLNIVEPELELIHAHALYQAFCKQRKSWLQIRTHLTVEQGIFSFPQNQGSCFFHLIAHTDTHSIGNAYLKAGSQFTLAGSASPEGVIKIDLQFIGLELKQLIPSFDWKVEKGILNGSLALSFTPTSLVEAEGDVAFSDLAVTNEHLDCRAEIERLDCQCRNKNCTATFSDHARLVFNQWNVQPLEGEFSFSRYRLQALLNDLPLTLTGTSLHDAELNYAGPADALKPFLPPLLGQRLQPNPLTASAHFARRKGQIEVEGFVDQMHFGFTWGDRVSNGWLSASQLPLDKYFGVPGEADIEGVFDQNALALTYHLHRLKLEALEVDSYQKLPAAHRFDFAAHTHSGTLPLEHCRLKSADMLFKGEKLNLAISQEGIKMDAQGALELPKAGASITPLKFHADNLHFSEIEGVLSFGGEQIALTNGSLRLAEQAAFDVAVGAHARLAGTASIPEPGRVQFTLDPAVSRFGTLHPASFLLTLKEWEVEEFQLSSEFSLQELEPFLPDWKGEGAIALQIDYQPESRALRCRAFGEKITLWGHPFHTLSFEGHKIQNAYCIDQLHLDELSLSADLLRTPKSWKIEFLGLRYGQTVLLGLDGEYSDSGVKGRVNLLDLKIFNGAMRSTGAFTIEHSKLSPRWKLDAELTAQLRSFNWNGLQFSDMENIACHVRSDRGITLKGVKGTANQIAFQIESADYDLNHQELSLNTLDFKLPPSELQGLAQALQPYLPEGAAPLIAGMKKEGEVQGRLDLELAPPYHHLRLALGKGVYSCFGREHEIDQFTLDCEPDAYTYSTKCRYQLCDFWVHGQAGELILTDAENSTLVLKLEDSSIAKGTGRFCGLTVDVAKEEGVLCGEIKAETAIAKQLLPEFLREQIEYWALAGPLTFKGKWLGEIPFRGSVEGTDLECGGRPWHSFSADLALGQEKITLQNIQLADPSGEVEAEQIDIERGMAAVPLLKITDFKTRLPFLVKQLSVHNLQGELLKPETYKGTGELVFTSTEKRSGQNTIFAIPPETISRIGLDMTALTPAKGTIFFDIRDGKFYFTKFKEVFGANKVSKFYLSQGDSYMDFQSNLHVQLRMKQNNLLFKITELFTFSVQGTLENPTYSLLQQR